MNPIFQVEIQFLQLRFSLLVGTLEKGLQKLNSMKLCLKNCECLGQRKLHKCGFGIKKIQQIKYATYLDIIFLVILFEIWIIQNKSRMFLRQNYMSYKELKFLIQNIQVFNQKNQDFYPKIQDLLPKNQVFYPKNQVLPFAPTIFSFWDR